MAQSAPANRTRTRTRLAALAGVAGDGQGNSERNRISHDDRFATAGLSSNQTRGPPVGFAAALTGRGWPQPQQPDSGHPPGLNFSLWPIPASAWLGAS